MLIKELAQRSGVSAKTIRYYESIGLLPKPQRSTNDYRQYTTRALERLQFIVSARSLGLSLASIHSLLAARDQDALPCNRLVASFQQRIAEIDQHIAELLSLRATLEQVCQNARALAPDKKCDEHCACYFISPDLPIRKEALHV